MTDFRELNVLGLQRLRARVKEDTLEAFTMHADCEALEKSAKRLEEYIAASGQTDSFLCFMVDFIGVGGVEVIEQKDVAEMLDGLSPGPKLPTLYSVVEEWLKSQPVALTDHGYGIASWHLGCHCTPGQAWLLVKDGKLKFEKAVKSGLLQIVIHPWNMAAVE